MLPECICTALAVSCGEKEEVGVDGMIENTVYLLTPNLANLSVVLVAKIKKGDAYSTGERRKKIGATNMKNNDGGTAHTEAQDETSAFQGLNYYLLS